MATIWARCASYKSDDQLMLKVTIELHMRAVPGTRQRKVFLEKAKQVCQKIGTGPEVTYQKDTFEDGSEPAYEAYFLVTKTADKFVGITRDACEEEFIGYVVNVAHMRK